MLEQEPRLLEKPLIYLGHPDWPTGVVGIVASRLVELYHRPTMLFNTSDPITAKGSARSVNGINIIAAIREHEPLLDSCGGHPMAAGLSVPAQNFDSLKYELYETIARMAEESNVRPSVIIDRQIELKDLGYELVTELQQLAPFGPGNPPVMFCASGLEIESATTMGKSSEHEKLTLSDGEGNLHKSLWWQSVGLPHPSSRFDLAFTATLKKFKGVVDIQLEWQDYRDTVVFENQPDTRKKSSEVENIDLRESQEPMSAIKQLLSCIDLFVFAESNIPEKIESFTRNELSSAQNLVMLTSPPTMEILHSIIQNVKPAKIYWVLCDPLENNLSELLKSVGRGIKQNTEKETIIVLSEFAASCASTPAIISLILQWYEARGSISIHSMDGDTAVISVLQSDANAAEAARLQNQISTSHAEVTAFRKYLHTVQNPSSLLPEKKKGSR
jgi:single-stranded-DNA-specific exonuclease